MRGLARLDEVISETISRGIGHLVDEGDGEGRPGRHVVIRGRRLVNFGSCGYLGLELDPRVKRGAIEATRRYGVELSSSRAYLSSALYPVLEEHLERITGQPTLLAPTTTLAHLAALPVLVEADDVFLVDRLAHSSLQLAAKLLRADGILVETVGHADLAAVAEKLRAHRGRRVWYAGDGVYSMHGDVAPLAGLGELLAAHEHLHLYLDDAHGVGWAGRRGRGVVLDALAGHPRSIVVAGLAKGFGTGGAGIVCPTGATKALIARCGPTQIFSGPLQPPMVGAAIASARIHLSDELPALQAEVRDRMRMCAQLLPRQPLAQVSTGESPIVFLRVGETERARAIVRRVMDAGYWLNIAQFPAVPARDAGLRFMLTRNVLPEDVEGLVDAIARAVVM